MDPVRARPSSAAAHPPPIPRPRRHAADGFPAPAGPTSLRGARTPLSTEQAGRHLATAWREVTGREPSAATVAALTAQWALETGRGVSMRGWNFAGIKGRSEEGGSAAFSTREGHGATERRVVDRFRTYSSPEAGARDYVALLSRRFPASFEAAASGDARAFGRALGREGWYTDDPARYSASLASLQREIATGGAGLEDALRGAPRVEAPEAVVHGFLWMLAARARRG